MDLADVFLPGVSEPVVAIGGSRFLAVLGTLQVDGASPGSARQRRLLTILAVAALEGRSISTDDFTTALYGADTGLRSRRALSTELWRARQLLGPQSIISGADGHRLDTDLVAVDALAFRGLVADGREAVKGRDHPAAATTLAAALDLWRGDPLLDWDDDPHGQAAIANLTELRLGCIEDLAESLIALDRAQHAIRLLEGLVEAGPQREHAWALLAECHLAIGDRRGARGAFDAARRALAEYGVDPGTELSAVRELIAGRTTGSARTQRDDLPGRSAVLAELSGTVVEALERRQAALTVISGEAGIGKSAVVNAVASGIAGRPVAGGSAVVVARAVCDRRLAQPYAAVAPVIHQFQECALGGGVAFDTALDTHREDTLPLALAGLLEEAARRTGALVLVVEDAHWATVELLEVLRLVQLRRAAVPLAVVLTVREPTSGDTDRGRALHELRRHADYSEVLEGLTVEATAELLDIDVERAGELHRLTGGNPLYLRSLTITPDGEVIAAPSLDDALDDHIDALQVEVLEVLEVAAAIGRSFDVRVLTAAVGREPLALDAVTVAEAIARAESRGILEHAGATEPFLRSFSHALVRDRLYARSPARRRTLAHAAVAAALERRLDSTPADLLAHHSRLGWPMCPTTKAVGALHRAGEAAAREFGFREALDHFEQALDLAAMDPQYDEPDQLAALLAAAGQAATWADDLVRARVTWTALRDHGRKHDDAVTSLQGSIGLVRTYFDQRIDATALDAMAEDLVAAAGQPERPARLTDHMIVDALSLLDLYRPEWARDLHDRIFAAHPSLRTRVLEHTWAFEPAATGLAVAEELTTLPDADPLGAALRLWASEVTAGRRSLHDARDTWSHRGDEQAQWEARTWRIMTVMVTGDFARATRLIELAEADVEHLRDQLLHTERTGALMGLRQFIAMQRGDIATLLQLAGTLRPSLGSFRPTARFFGALQLVTAGNIEAAVARCDQLHDEFVAGLVPVQGQNATITGYVQACQIIEHAPGLALSRELLRPHLGEHVLLFLTQYWGSVSHHVGKISAFFDDLDDAEELLRRGFEEHRAAGAPVYEVHSMRLLASTLWHRGKRAEAERLFIECRELATRLGMASIQQMTWPPPRAFAAF